MSDDLVKRLKNPRPMSMFLTRADQASDWTELLKVAANRIEELEAKLELISEEWHGAVYGDLENGVAVLNRIAWEDFHRRYPLVSNFGATINRIIDGDKGDE